MIPISDEVQDQKQQTNKPCCYASSFLEPVPTLPPIPPPPPAQQSEVNSIYHLTRMRDIVQYLHKACFYPPKSTWIKAIQAGYFTTWPGLTSDAVMKFLPEEPATIKGHFKQIRQNVRSTGTNKKQNECNQVIMTSSLDERENYIAFKVIDLEHKFYTD